MSSGRCTGEPTPPTGCQHVRDRAAPGSFPSDPGRPQSRVTAEPRATDPGRSSVQSFTQSAPRRAGPSCPAPSPRHSAREGPALLPSRPGGLLPREPSAASLSGQGARVSGRWERPRAPSACLGRSQYRPKALRRHRVSQVGAAVPTSGQEGTQAPDEQPEGAQLAVAGAGQEGRARAGR